MKKKSKAILHILLACALVAIGILIGKTISFPYFEIDKKINVVTLFSIINTLLVAYIVGAFLNKQLNTKKSEKELLVKKIDCINNELEPLLAGVKNGKIDYFEAVAIIKNAYMKIKTIGSILYCLKYGTKITDSCKIKIKNIRKLLTNSPIASPAVGGTRDLTICVSDNNIVIDKRRIPEIEQRIENLQMEIFKLQIDVNSK